MEEWSYGTGRDVVWDWLKMWGAVGRDVASLILAALASFLAWRAIKLGKQQIAIAQKQHELEQAVQLKRSLLTLFVPSSTRSYVVDDQETHKVWIKNEGEKASDGMWFIGIAKGGSVQLTSVEASTRMSLTSEDIDGLGAAADDHSFVAYRLTKELLPGEQFVCCQINLKPSAVTDSYWRRTVMWFTRTPDARNPTKGYTAIELPAHRTSSYD